MTMTNRAMAPADGLGVRGFLRRRWVRLQRLRRRGTDRVLADLERLAVEIRVRLFIAELAYPSLSAGHRTEPSGVGKTSGPRSRSAAAHS